MPLSHSRATGRRHAVDMCSATASAASTVTNTLRPLSATTVLVSQVTGAAQPGHCTCVVAGGFMRASWWCGESGRCFVRRRLGEQLAQLAVEARKAAVLSRVERPTQRAGVETLHVLELLAAVVGQVAVQRAPLRRVGRIHILEQFEHLGHAATVDLDRDMQLVADRFLDAVRLQAGSRQRQRLKPPAAVALHARQPNVVVERAAERGRRGVDRLGHEKVVVEDHDAIAQVVTLDGEPNVVVDVRVRARAFVALDVLDVAHPRRHVADDHNPVVREVLCEAAQAVAQLVVLVARPHRVDHVHQPCWSPFSARRWRARA
ncbi:hypothetical protein Henu3_gp101 [Mycobacterium phage Henu3]|uniref:Uncharacterized protein n=1 Tax=Mycobacterium phage Henu3 TaxID=2492961 RepID=A0A410T7T0_9CAUD|nr:hypothetical protein I5G68_gp84 [Mycobacterium phage Henu3]QAU05028.1 hypothetical protein Henu3_gp101 [Mycobacterium phage Henu3]